MVKIYGLYSRPVVKGIEFTEPSMAQQQFADESDLNNIVDKNMHFKDPAFVTKLMLSGKMSDKTPLYGDFTQVCDYQTALNTVQTAQEQFSALPAKVRDKFDNDPAKMLDFCNRAVNDDTLYSEGVSLGLFEKREIVENNNSLQTSENLVEAGSNAVSETVTETSAPGLT